MIYSCAQNSQEKALNPCSSMRSTDLLKTVEVYEDSFRPENISSDWQPFSLEI